MLNTSIVFKVSKFYKVGNAMQKFIKFGTKVINKAKRTKFQF
jgi:hypothetical protein